MFSMYRFINRAGNSLFGFRVKCSFLFTKKATGANDSQFLFCKEQGSEEQCVKRLMRVIRSCHSFVKSNQCDLLRVAHFQRAPRGIRSQLLFFKERQEQISQGCSLKRAILSERSKSERAKEPIPNPAYYQLVLREIYWKYFLLHIHTVYAYNQLVFIDIYWKYYHLYAYNQLVFIDIYWKYFHLYA